MERSYVLKVIGDIKDYQKKLLEVPGLTEKQAAAAALKWGQKMQKAQEDASRAARDSAKRASDAWAALGDAGGAAGGAAKKLRGLLSNIAPGAAEAAGAIDDVGDGLEVMASAGASLMGPLGALVLGVTAAAVAYKALSMELARAEAVQTRQRDVVEALAPFYRDVEAAKRKLKVATGELTEKEEKELEIRDKWNLSAATTIQRLQEQRDLLVKEIEPGMLDTALAFYGVKDAYDETAHSVAQSMGWWNPFAMMWDRSAQQAQRNKDAYEALGGQIEKVGKAAGKAAAAEIGALPPTTKHTSALHSQVDAFEQLREAQEAAAARWKRYATAIAEVQAIGQKWTETTLDDEERIIAARDADIAKIGEQATAALMAAKSDDERAAIVRARDEAVKQAQLGAIAQVADLRAQAAKEDEESRAAAAADSNRQTAEEIARARELQAVKRGIALDYISAVQTATDLFLAWNERAQARTQAKIEAGEGTLTARQLEQLEKRKRAQKAAAIAAFVVARVAATATAVVNALMAGSNALASIPPPANVPASIAATAAGMVTAGAIAASPPPKFAVGSSTGVRGTREVPMIGHEGELIVREDAARRPGVREQVGRWNAGVAGGAPSIIVADRYQGRLWPTTLREAGRLGYLTTSSGRRGSRFGQFIERGA